MENLEMTALAEIAKRNLVTRTELVGILNMSKESVDSIVTNLESRGLLRKVAPVGETSYTLTQKGMKMIQDS
jgi:predicted transcriptional regulator